MARDIAPRVSPLMTDIELRSMAHFFRDPQWQDVMERIVDRAMEKNPRAGEGFTREQIDRLNAFGETPEGRPIARGGAEVLHLLAEEIDAAAPRVRSRVQQRMLHNICAALESQCPRDLRREVDGI